MEIAKDPRFCYAPFTSLYIAGNGNVYPCCSYDGDDVVIGNIFTDSVDEILFGARAILNRKQSINLTLPCNGCNYAHKPHNPKNIEISISQVLNWEYEQLGKLQVEVGYFCNSKCSFCEQPHMTKRSLPYEKLKEIILKCRPKEINLQGGEVYYNAGGPEFVEWVGENKNGARAFMHTNCVLPVKFAQTCVDTFDALSINMYGASPSTFKAVTGLKFEKAIRFIEQLVSLRSQNIDTSVPELMFKMTTCPTTFHEIPDAILLADQLKLDSARFSFDKFVMEFTQRYNNEFLSRIWDRTNQVIEEVSIPVSTSSLEKYGFKRGEIVSPAIFAALNARRERDHYKDRY